MNFEQRLKQVKHGFFLLLLLVPLRLIYLQFFLREQLNSNTHNAPVSKQMKHYVSRRAGMPPRK